MTLYDPIADYAEYLANEAGSYNSTIHKFRLLFNPSDGGLHIFFEGEDDFLFYPSFLRSAIQYDAAHTYNCNGKPVIRELKDYVTRNGYPLDRLMFFVDRDFDDYLNCQMLEDTYTYITDGYSIENHLATIDSARIFLSDIVRLNRNDVEFDLIIEQLEKSLTEFSKAIKPIMAWCIAMRAKGGKINLNNVKMAKVFDVSSNGKVKRKRNGFNTFVKLSKACDIEVDTNDIRQTIALINTDEPKKWLRGKYALWHFELALVKALESINADLSANEKPLKIPRALREHKLFETMGGRIQAPLSLISFLENYRDL